MQLQSELVHFRSHSLSPVLYHKHASISIIREIWVCVSKYGKLAGIRSYCTRTSGNGKKPNKEIVSSMSNDSAESSTSRYNEAYQQIENLDFMTATKILFTDGPKKRKFGFDFHLVQFFFAAMPSLAVFLVAQYARHEMRLMDAELEEKKEQEEEKAKEEESSPKGELLEVKVRLEKLEETMKEIVVEAKKGKQENAAEKGGASIHPNMSQQISSPGITPQRNHQGTSNQAPVPGSAQNDQRHKNENRGPSSSDPKR